MAHKFEVERSNLRKNLIQENSEFLNNKLYLEFGVMKGTSILEFYNLYKQFNINSTFYGFDSFKGLPPEIADENNPWPAGKFSTFRKINTELLTKNEIKIIDGWFSETLTEHLASELGKRSVGIVHIDCDIYTSTMQVLEFLIKYELLSDGAIIIYDDWGAYLMKGFSIDREYDLGEAKAHKEIVRKYNLTMNLESKNIIDPSFYCITIFKYQA